MSERKRVIRPGEMLAMDVGHLHQGPEAFFWLCGGGVTPNERRDSVAIVHVRDALDHHASSWDDNYEAILARVRAAMSGQDAADAHRAAHEYDEDYQPMGAVPPSAVVLCIDSPGGVVSGLNETVYALQHLRAKTKVPLVAFVNELAASAAYALACACDAIYCPPTAIVGSVGVISTMISQARKNDADGYDVALLTSGKCKADGHAHAPLTDGAKSREQARVDKLAAGFFAIASKARKIPVATVGSFQAAIYLGPDAARRGLVDEVISFDDTILALQPNDASLGPKADGNETDRRANDATRNKVLDATRHGASHSTNTGDSAMLKIKALIAKTLAAIGAEKDPEKIAALYADLSAYKKTEKHIEHHSTEEGEPDESDPNKPDPNKDEDKDKDEDEDEEEACNPEDEEEAKSALALIEASTGMTGSKALGAARSLFNLAKDTSARVAQLEQSRLADTKSSLIVSAKGQYLTKSEAAWLASQPLATVEGFVEMRRKSGVIVHTDESTILKPKAAQPGSEAALPESVVKMIDQAVACCTTGDPRAFRAALVAAHTKAQVEQANGQNGRY